MSKKLLTRDSQFTVGEEKILDYILAGLFLALFIYGLIDAFLKNFNNIDASSMIFVISLALSFMFFSKGRSKVVYIRVNKKGIYHMDRLVTAWPDFVKAYVKQEEKAFSISDNFVMIVEYKKGSTGIRRKISLGNTQNKSEEEIMEAVKFFLTEYKNEHGIVSPTITKGL